MVQDREQGKYANLTQDQFDGILEGIVDGMTAAQILAVAGVYEVLSEALNEDILDRWEEDHPEDVIDEDAPKVGDLVFDPRYTGVALQPAYSSVERFNHREGISTYNVDLANGDEDVPIEYYDSAWFLSDDYAAGMENDEQENVNDAA